MKNLLFSLFVGAVLVILIDANENYSGPPRIAAGDTKQLISHKKENMYIYVKIDPATWTVGYVRPDGEFTPESDWESLEKAAARVAYLNGEKKD